MDSCHSRNIHPCVRGLGWFHSKYWLLFTAFVGLNLLQSAFTKWCLMEEILDKLGVARNLCKR